MILKENFLPKFVTDIPTIYDTLQALELEILNLEDKLDELERESLLFKATQKGLRILEMEFGLKESVLSDVERQERLKAKLRGAGTTTPHMLKQTALAFNCGEVEISFDPELYKIKIKFISQKGRPKNEMDFKNAIQEIIPAHLSLEFFYSYTIWNDIQNAFWDDFTKTIWLDIEEEKWADIETKTWIGLETYKQKESPIKIENLTWDELDMLEGVM